MVSTLDQFSDPRDKQFEVLRAEIGNTPLLPIAELPEVWVKHEHANPGGSHYDRAYLETIFHLETTGLIRPGDQLRDITSGSAGNSLALLAEQLDYHARILVPGEIPSSRLKPMLQTGAEVVSTGLGYIEQASLTQREEIMRFARDRTWRRIRPADTQTRALIFENIESGERVCFVNHSENDLTVAAFARIAHELIQRMQTPPRAVALAIGNGTTIAGIAPVLHEHWPATQLIGYTGDNTERIENFGTATAHTSVPLRFQPTALAALDQQLTVSSHERDTMHERVNGHKPLAEQLGRSSLMGLVIAERHAPAIAIGYDTMKRY